MKLIFIRHGEPDYEHDTLTEKGWKEAQLLSHYLIPKFTSSPSRIHFYVSPLGRARDTASFTLHGMHRTAEICGWLREFPGLVCFPDNSSLKQAYSTFVPSEAGNQRNPIWDMYPSYLSAHPELLDPEDWRKSELAAYSNIVPAYEYIIREFNLLMEKHGYQRDGQFFRVLEGNNDTLVFFCHFGVTCAILSSLMHTSPILLWHSFVFAPTSLTILNTEERQKGIASLRAAALGDISHLRLAGEIPSFAARFCENYGDGTRCD